MTNEHDNTINHYADIHFVYQYDLQRLTNHERNHTYT